MSEENKLSKEDQDRVDNYLESGFNSVERKSFRSWRLVAVIWVVVAVLGYISWFIGKKAGYL